MPTEADRLADLNARLERLEITVAERLERIEILLTELAAEWATWRPVAQQFRAHGALGAYRAARAARTGSEAQA